MTTINSLLNLGNIDFQNSLGRKNREEDESIAAAREQLAQFKQEQRQLSQQLQESAESQQAMRRIQQAEMEIQQLSQSQAQMMLQLVIEKIIASSHIQLEQTQEPGERGLLVPTYI